MLDYLLSAIGKPGRAVRGLLGGNLNEGLAALPFSDSLGLTNPDEEVTSNALLRELGGDPDSTMGQVGSFVLGAATDPLTYMGGALARGLLGRLAGKSGDVYDLVSPAERALDAKNASMVDGAFPIPARAAAPEVAGAGRRAGPLIEGADATMPAGELLRKIPDPEGFAHLTGVQPDALGGMYAPGQYGVAADRLAETGDRVGAFRTSLGAWDEVASDLERLHPELRQALGGYAPGGHTPMELAWQYPIASRRRDLEAALQLGRGGAVPPDLIPLIEAQQARLAGLARASSTGDEAALHAVRDITGGLLRPTEAVSQAAEYMPHLPYDEAGLRRLAAAAQRRSLVSGMDDELQAIMTRAADEGLDPAALMAHPTGRQALLDAFTPDRLAAGGYEPSIVRTTLARPLGEGEASPELAALLDALRGPAGPAVGAGAVDSALLNRLRGRYHMGEF